MKLNKKLLYYSLPILFGGYLIYKQFAKKDDNADAKPPKPSPATPTNTNSSDYPLKKGSNNETVRALQTLLNTALTTKLTTDGIFGTKTENALFQLTSKKSLNSPSEFESVKKQLVQTNELSSNLDWAWKLIDAYNSGLYNYLVVRSTIRLIKVQKNFLGQWKSTQEIITMPPKNYSLNDYALRSATNKGDLRIEITNGQLAGMYLTESDTNLKNIDIV